MTRLWYAALLGAIALALSGCGEVESCKKGDPGCLDGPADPVTGCKFDLTANASGICVEGPSGQRPSDNCGCPEGSLCTEQRTCVDMCVLPSPLPVVKSAAPACPAVGQTTFQAAAIAACSQECIRRGEYCGRGCDPAVFCTPARAQTALMLVCPTGDPACAVTACQNARDKRCEDYNCLGEGTLNCAGITCTSTCPDGLPEFLNDGLCDDGDLSNASSDVCAWGSDCGDCGPRRGAAPNMDLDLGAICAGGGQCGGDMQDARNATGWCVTVENASLSLQRCVPDCSTTRACPAGFMCTALAYESNGQDVNLVDARNLQVRACLPTMCGR